MSKFAIPLSMYKSLLLFGLSFSLQLMAGGAKPPIYEEGDNSIRGTGYSTGCTDRDLERAHSRYHRDMILDARENPTKYAEFITFLLPANRGNTVQVSRDGMDLLVNVGMRLGRCDEVSENNYQPVIFPVSDMDGVVAFRKKGIFGGSSAYEEKYSQQTESYKRVGVAQVVMPLAELLSNDEVFELREGGIVDLELWVFHGVNRESEAKSFGNVHNNRWIYSMDRDRIPSMRRVRKIDPFLVIRFQISMNSNGKLMTRALRFGLEKEN